MTSSDTFDVATREMTSQPKTMTAAILRRFFDDV